MKGRFALMSEDITHESKPLLGHSKAGSTSHHSKQRGYVLSFLVAFLSVSSSVFTGQASASPVPHYTGNLFIAISGAIALALMLLGSGVQVLVDKQGAKECVSFGLYNA